MKTSPIFALLLVAASATGCARRTLSSDPLPLDRVECARCRMLISTDRHAGEIVSTEEETRFYDDIGCLAADWALHRGNARAFVTVDKGRWIDVREAAFAHPSGERTAMGSGLVAFSADGEARAVDRTGRAMTFDEVVQTSGGKK